MTAAVSTLRQIAIHVEEPESGGFHWVLTERRHGEVWQEFDRSERPARSFHAAMADGLVALERLVDDLHLGPRTEPAAKGKAKAKAQDSSAPDQGSGHETGSDRTAADKRRSMFGFGPVR